MDPDVAECFSRTTLKLDQHWWAWELEPMELEPMVDCFCCAEVGTCCFAVAGMKLWSLKSRKWRELLLPWMSDPTVRPFGRSVVASWSEPDFGVVGALTWSRGELCGNVIARHPLFGVAGGWAGGSI